MHPLCRAVFLSLLLKVFYTTPLDYLLLSGVNTISAFSFHRVEGSIRTLSLYVGMKFLLRLYSKLFHIDPLGSILRPIAVICEGFNKIKRFLSPLFQAA